MKLDNEAVRELVRKRREEAGETIQPTRRVRRRLHRGPAPVAEGDGAAAVPAGGHIAEAAEPSHAVTEIVGVRGQAAEVSETAEAAEVPEMAVGAAEAVEVAVAAEAPAESPVEGAPADESAIGGVSPEAAPTAGDGGVVVIDSDPPTPTDQGIEGAIIPHTEEGAEDEPIRAEAEEPAPKAAKKRKGLRRAAAEASAEPETAPRPAPRIPSLEDAYRAERLLERLHVPEFQEQARELRIPGLLNGLYVSMLRAVNETLSLRDLIAHSSAARQETIERARRFKKKYRDFVKESGAKLEAAKQEQAASEADRDSWRARCRDAEAKAEEGARNWKAAEDRLEAVTRTLELEREGSKTLSEQLRVAEDQASLAESRVQVADERAETAWAHAVAVEARAEEEGKKARGMEELNKELSRAVKEASERAEEEARKFAAERLVVTAQAWDAEARFEEAESRAWRAEVEAKSAAERAQKIVSNIIDSPAVQREVAEAAADAYLQGFGDCRTKMAIAYGLDDTEAIRPGDPDVPETPVVGAGVEEAADDEGEEAGEAPHHQQ